MEVDRTHRPTATTTTATSRELFICFTSRLSSSSTSATAMKISKSFFSPGRSRDGPISLSTSLSRRLRTNGSIKGGQASPMFPTGGKKNRSGFENPEPSSPKVTCIGQVRVKSKKKQQSKKLRSLSRRHSTGGGGGEVSFRRLEQARDGFSQSQSQSQNQNMGLSYNQQPPSNVSIQESMPQRNQRWVHLPLTICEALRTFGSEFSCLFPCKSSCFSASEREKEEREAAAARSGDRNAGQSSCGTVFRWLVAMQDGEGGGKGGREIELVVGDYEDEDSEERRRKGFMEREVRTSRRHVFDDLEIVDNKIHLKDEGGGGGRRIEEGRVSICIPPKNALLLMRCRSDPVQMEALTSKFWESPAPFKDDIDEDEEVVDDDENEFKECEIERKEKMVLALDEVIEDKQNVWGEEANLEIEKENKEEILEINEVVEEEINELRKEIEDESMFLDCLFEEFADEHVLENVEEHVLDEESNAETRVEDNGEVAEFEVQNESIEEEDPQDQNFQDANEILTSEASKLCEKTGEDDSKDGESGSQMEEEELVKGSEMQVKTENENKVAALPDCLLLMMCEPKLSMEVSKETWVSSTDFIRWQPQRKKKPMIKPINSADNESTNKKAVNVDVKPIKSNNLPPLPAAYRETKPILHQPPRSSCTLPAAAAASMATMIEQKLVNAMGCEPFVLTRCKSEPMRNASKLVPETCFWKNRKLEPLRRAAYGVSTAGVGF